MTISDCLMWCVRSSARSERFDHDVTSLSVGHPTTAELSCDDDETLNKNFDDDICAGCLDLDLGGDQPRLSPPEDCFDPCMASTPRRQDREARRGSRSPGGCSRKPGRSASEICGECSAKSRRGRHTCDDDGPRCPPRNPCPERPVGQARYRQATNDVDGPEARFKHGAAERGEQRRPSPAHRHRSVDSLADQCCPDRHDDSILERPSTRTRSGAPHRRATNDDGPEWDSGPSAREARFDYGAVERGEQRPGRPSPNYRHRSVDSLAEHCCPDRHDDGSVERTTTRTRGGGPCCPEPEERDCESESRLLCLVSTVASFRYICSSLITTVITQ